MGELTIENEQPPDALMDDLKRLRNVIKVERVTVEDGPNDGWTMRIEDETSREDFESIVKLVENTVTGTDDIRPVYERTRAAWLISLRY